MTVHAFTSFSYSYLNRARVLAKTLRAQHPDWVLWAIVTDACPPELPHDWTEEAFDRVLFPADLLGEAYEPWLFGHSIVEACTAVKGAAACHILDQADCEKLLYFDPDIAVFNSMQEVVDILDEAAIVLTPHQTEPAGRGERQNIMDNEISSLMHGAYNLGFIAISNVAEGRRFAEWWDQRLRDWCHDRKEIGVFVDQKWCDLVPCFFDDVRILRDPGYNVASWNLAHRRMEVTEDGVALINGRPLRFYHFTKLGPLGDAMTQRYAGENYEIFELWAWYKAEVDAATETRIPKGYWHFKTFDNGRPIPDGARRLYRERKDLQSSFKAPRETQNGFYRWLETQTDLLEGPKA
ncbi:MAG: hypothetical protein AAF718_04605 [Pseudomonadota bacterium]